MRRTIVVTVGAATLAVAPGAYYGMPEKTAEDFRNLKKSSSANRASPTTPSSALAGSVAGRTILPLPRHGYTGDVFGTTLRLDDERPAVRPAGIRLGNEEWLEFRRLRWSGWGGARAVGRGPVHRCTENVGRSAIGRGVVRLGGRVTQGCEGSPLRVRVYLRIAFEVPGMPASRFRIVPTGAPWC